jgi:hypothetical protein
MLASRSVVHDLSDQGAEKWKFRIAKAKGQHGHRTRSSRRKKAGNVKRFDDFRCKSNSIKWMCHFGHEKDAVRSIETRPLILQMHGATRALLSKIT